ncbi:VOC family protein [Fictibacillus iocasae]|uniref:VOC family protein n=1 Tax=Fictibacillus iocasae TaxID=2715437 RepID=A0ABW2NKE5_9BACL
MIYEVTFQVCVSDFNKGVDWYKALLQREPDFKAHEGFVEWELLLGAWLQVAEGTPVKGNGPFRLGVSSIEEERYRICRDLNVAEFDIFSRDEVPVMWATFTDPWGNRIGLFEYLDKKEMQKKIGQVSSDSRSFV